MDTSRLASRREGFHPRSFVTLGTSDFRKYFGKGNAYGPPVFWNARRGVYASSCIQRVTLRDLHQNSRWTILSEFSWSRLILEPMGLGAFTESERIRLRVRLSGLDMVHRRSRASGASGRSSRSTFQLLLTDRELAELDRAVAESGAWTRSLLVAEAVHAGLLTQNLTLTRDRRRRRVLVRVPAKMLDDLRHLAFSHDLTQQAILRHFLFQYIANKAWNPPEEDAAEPARQLEEVAVQ